MIKVLIYSSKEIYDNASYEGRAESDIVAYRKDDGYYKVTKNKTDYSLGEYTTIGALKIAIRYAENNKWAEALAAVSN